MSNQIPDTRYQIPEKKNKKAKKMDRRQFIIQVAKSGGYFALGIALTDAISYVPKIGKKDPYSLPGGAGDFTGT